MVPLTVQEDRKKVVDFTIPFFYSNFGFIMRMPDPKTVKWRIYLDMFSSDVLLSIATVLVLASLLLYTMEHLSWILNGRKPSEKKELADIVEYIYGALVLQGKINKLYWFVFQILNLTIGNIHVCHKMHIRCTDISTIEDPILLNSWNTILIFLRPIYKSKISYFPWHSYYSWSPTALFFEWPGVHVHLLDLVRVPGRRVLRESGRQHGAGPQGEDSLWDTGGSCVSNRVQVGLRIGDLLGFCATGIASTLILIVSNFSLNYFIFFSLYPFSWLWFSTAQKYCRNQTLKCTRKSTKERANLRQRIKRCYPSAVTFTSGNWWRRSTCLSPLSHICRRSVSRTAAPCYPLRDLWRTTVPLAFLRIHRSKRYSLSGQLKKQSTSTCSL